MCALGEKRKQGTEGALSTEGGTSAAEVFSGEDDEGMKFVEEFGIGGQGFFEDGAESFIGFFSGGEAMALENAAGVGIHNEDRVIAGVKQNGVGSFGADAVNAEELFAQGCGGSTEHCG